MGLVYDQATIDIGADFVGEEHALLGTLIDLAVVRVQSVRFIELSPLALTVLQSGSIAVRNSHMNISVTPGSKVGPGYDIGKYNGVPLTLNPYEDGHIRVYGTSGNDETIELKNIRFI